jgi:hypothetical protein
MDGEYNLIPGERTNEMREVRNALRNKINADRTTRWDENAGGMVTSPGADWRNSPRIIKVAIYNPEYLPDLGPGANAEIPFNNVALFFVEDVTDDNAITGRFLYYVTGSDGGDDDDDAGSLVKHVRLVE